MKVIEIIKPGSFEPAHHWYEKSVNATIHPLIYFFLHLTKERIVKRYCHLHPQVKETALTELLEYQCRYFQWAGADLINVTTESSFKQMVVIENNSCPSGQKSMPLGDEANERGGYSFLVEKGFQRYVKSKKNRVDGALAVLYDKNYMEASGYASMIADQFEEDVFLVPYYHKEDKHVLWKEGVLYIRVDGELLPIRSCFRYLTQKPWNRLPIHSRTIVFNPIIACLAGGRNKLMASKAYELFNADLHGSGLKINIPETVWDVSKNEIPIWIQRFGGHAVVKDPYSNAGQGVFTIVNKKELDNFMSRDFHYDKFIVQSLIGNYQWSSVAKGKKLYHVGTLPDKKGNTYVFDLRIMICNTDEGLQPICAYSRRARIPLLDKLDSSTDSWSMLGTNLSSLDPDGEWTTDTSRLLLMDRRDFNKLGLGLDDLIEGYIQTVLSTIAIDKLAIQLFNSKNRFRKRLFESLNDDHSLIEEIKID